MAPPSSSVEDDKDDTSSEDKEEGGDKLRRRRGQGRRSIGVASTVTVGIVVVLQWRVHHSALFVSFAMESCTRINIRNRYNGSSSIYEW